MKLTFRIKAVWNPETKVFCSQSDIEGLHIEATTLDEFEEIMLDVAPDLIMTNHRNVPEITERSLKALIPIILWQRPDTETRGGTVRSKLAESGLSETDVADAVAWAR